MCFVLQCHVRYGGSPHGPGAQWETLGPRRRPAGTHPRRGSDRLRFAEDE